MLLRTFILSSAFVAVAGLADAAGFKILNVPADSVGPALKVAEWSPCKEPAEQVEVGPFTLPAVFNCPVLGGKLPLIIISHGFGGTYLGHHDTAEALADAGFIVVALNHPDDTASREAKERDLTGLRSRPTDVKRLIDFMLGSSSDKASIDAQRIGFFGFSRGGYTGLVLAGAMPDLNMLSAHCQDPTGAVCPVTDQAAIPKLDPGADTRIKAYVLADPLSSVFATPESLRAVTAPIQLWASEHGGDGVSPRDVSAVAQNLPAKPELHLVANSSHFAFLTVCPPALRATLPELCNDDAGFDRATFHREFNAKVSAYFRESLAGVAQH